jgi:hypothetical protein
MLNLLILDAITNSLFFNEFHMFLYFICLFSHLFHFFIFCWFIVNSLLYRFFYLFVTTNFLLYSLLLNFGSITIGLSTHNTCKNLCISYHRSIYTSHGSNLYSLFIEFISIRLLDFIIVEAIIPLLAFLFFS